MKIVAIIPARYNSSRFPGKPLADICGKPMIWWVYQSVSKVCEIATVIVATDNTKIMDECEKYSIPSIMTSSKNKTSTERAYEVALQIPSDLYIVVNGDEPLIAPQVIQSIIPSEKPYEMYVGNLMSRITNPSEVIDFTNIKVVTDHLGNALLFSRSPIPYPKSSLNYDYYKHVGVLIYDLAALKFFTETSPGPIEKIEDINELRFLEHGIKIKMTKVVSNSLSVDTPKDLEYVIKCISKSH